MEEYNVQNNLINAEAPEAAPADDGMASLAAEFGFRDESINNNLELTQNLEGFANCFPDWDLHPPAGF